MTHLKALFASAEDLLTAYINGINAEKPVCTKNHIQYQARFSSPVYTEFSAFEHVSQMYGLNQLERFSLVLHTMIWVDKQYTRLLEKASIGKRKLCLPAILKVFHFAEKTVDIEDFSAVLSRLKDKFKLFILDSKGIISERLLEFILTNGAKDISVAGVHLYMPFESEPLLIREDAAQKTAALIKKDTVTLYGEKGAGRRTLIRRAAQILQIPILFVDHDELSHDHYITLCREAVLINAALCISGSGSRELVSLALSYSVRCILMDEDKTDDDFASIHIGTLSLDEAETLWHHALRCLPAADGVDVREFANMFRFTPAQINRIARVLMRNFAGIPVTKQDILTVAHTQNAHKLRDKGVFLPVHGRFEDLIVGSEQKKMLIAVCERVRYKHIVYDKWNFGGSVRYGRGVSMLFEGPPGTGKTMAAQIVASELSLEICKVDLSRIVSKYIGETEKSISLLFDEAKKSNVILLFDEADALMGKRTEVRDAKDKHANMEIAHLLQKMEEYDGVSIMTTNNLENIDTAFLRRIDTVIHFSFPDADTRKIIWRAVFPKNAPLAPDIDFDFLSARYEIPGGVIKNIALSAAFMAASRKSDIHMADIIQALKYEFVKQKKILLHEDFGEYGFLL